MNRVSYYPGCAVHGTGYEFEQSVRFVMEKLQTELVEVPDWNCCGASSAHVLNETMSHALPMRNLARADALKNDVLAIPCAACFCRMKITQHEVQKNPELRKHLEQVVCDGEAPAPVVYAGTTKVKSMLQYLYEDVGAEKLKSLVTRPLTGLKVASYYGCLLTRPKDIIQFDSAEYPISMDTLMGAIGATPTDFDHKTECCGASFSITMTEVVYDLVGKILDAAEESGADCIAVACPLCQANLDMRQGEIASRRGRKYNLPILYFTQLAALALGAEFKNLRFSAHIVPVEQILPKISAPMVPLPGTSNAGTNAGAAAGGDKPAAAAPK